MQSVPTMQLLEMKKIVGKVKELFFFFFGLLFFRAALMAYGVSQARGRIRAVDAGLHHSYSNIRSKPHL